MAAENYAESLHRLLAHEGGYSDYPSDPGGPTKFGITLAVYRQYAKPGVTAANVRAMTIGEAEAIYRARYWDVLRCDELPAGVDDAVFDYGVNSGADRAARALQRIVAVKDDGVIGPLTLAAAARRDAADVINALCDERLRFLRGLRTWPVFGKGWTRRVAEVRKAALALAGSPGGALATSGTVRPRFRSAQARLRAPVSSTALQTKGDPLMWATIKKWFKDSETIFWARLQVVLGAVTAAVMALGNDPNISAAVQSILKPQYVPYYVIAFGLLTELLRRRRAEDL